MHAKRTAAAAAILASALFAAPVLADGTIRCESRHDRYEYCSIRTDNRVKLVRQLSSTRCSYGVNWGYDRRGVWVDRGCRAEFRVGHGGHGHDHDRDDRHDDSGKAAAAAIAGIAIIAAIAGSQKGQTTTADVPAWAIGTFSAYDDFERVNLEITILPGGSVDGHAGGQRVTGTLVGWNLQIGRKQFRVEPAGNGFLATDVQSAGHRVHFQRTGSGY